ncbi:hypothetical protein HWQ46_23655 [Shewanella sp. D64]|uniref:hypothetical protein n=1 Tax=unclassified Shewanella TaxID=196818 RepID=UPI0022BA250E|nr:MULTISPECIES: hypothetical protein [unclassified Shewanella]MEC4728523.1 hypothetical protein [Shewanella sp. D64]MEC4740312.1 hypothetical protein [Shewanella sp. E94]WBJ94289.1 hypothetical protein HWQ47_20725 [Shewanella sp. MTB7]
MEIEELTLTNKITKNVSIFKVNKPYTLDCVIEKLNVDMNMKSDPNILNDILKNDMYLSDLKGFIDLLGGRLTCPQDMALFLEEVRSGIVSKHPALCELAVIAVRDDLISEPNNVLITRTLHYTYLLDLLLKAMVKDHRFMHQVYIHIMEKRRVTCGIRAGFIRSAIDIYKLTGDIFSVIKTKTKDADFKQYITVRTRGVINDNEIRGRRNFLTVNISEAVIADFVAGYKNNALSGAVIGAIKIKNVSISEGDRSLKLELSQEWCSLYHTWNFCFMTPKLDFLQILYPKLLAPVVANADPNDYIFVRGMGLWLSINSGLFKKAKKEVSPVLLNRGALAKIWGEINLKYAKELYQKERSMQLQGFGTIFMSNPRLFIKKAQVLFGSIVRKY